MKKLIVFQMLIIIQLGLIAQQTIQKKEYYDYLETQLKRTWNELGDGTYHGIEKAYYQSGKVGYVYNYYKGKPTEIKVYYEDGLPSMEIHCNNESLYNGTQSYWLYEGGKHYLKAQAKAVNGDYSEFKSFDQSGNLLWSYISDGKTEEYKEYKDKVVVTHLKFSEGHVSGFIGEKMKVENNEIQLINEPTVKGAIVDGKLYMQNDDSKWKSNRVKISDNQVGLDVGLYITHPSRGKMFDFRMTLVKKGERDTELTDNEQNNSYGYSYTTVYEEFNDLAKLTNYLLEQYVWDGKAVMEVNGVTQKEALYDKGVLITEKEFDNNGNLIYLAEGMIKTWYNADKTLKRQDIYDDKNEVISNRYYNHGIISQIDSVLANYTLDKKQYKELIRVRSFDAEGKIKEENIYTPERKLLTFERYNPEGQVIDNQQLRDDYSDIKSLTLDLGEKIVELITEINNPLESTSSEFGCLEEAENVYVPSSLCDKKAKNIFLAISTIYNHYLPTVIESVEAIEQRGGWEFENNEKLDTTNSYVDKIATMQEWKTQDEELFKTLIDFAICVQRFKDILASEEQVKLNNKGLKDVTNPEEIRAIIGI